MTQIKVLLIEDDPMVQEVNKEFIKSVPGFQVAAVAGNGEQGIQISSKKFIQTLLSSMCICQKKMA